MSRSPEEIKERYQDILRQIEQKYEEKREDLQLAQEIETYLSILADSKNMNVWWTVKYHYMDNDLNIHTVEVLGYDQEEESG